MCPGPSWEHQEASALLWKILDNHLRGKSTGCAFCAPADVTFSALRSVQPDVFVVPPVNGRRPRHFNEVQHLLLAIEVLSPGTARADRVAKRRLYANEGVSEYWVVDLDSRTIERSTPTDSRVEVLAETLQWLPRGAAETLTINLVEYFASVLDQ